MQNGELFLCPSNDLAQQMTSTYCTFWKKTVLSSVRSFLKKYYAKGYSLATTV